MPDNVKEARAWIDAWRNKQVRTFSSCQCLAVCSREAPGGAQVPLHTCLLLVPLAVLVYPWASYLHMLCAHTCDLRVQHFNCMPHHVLSQGGGSRDPSLPSWFPGAKLPGYLDGTLPAVSIAAVQVLGMAYGIHSLSFICQCVCGPCPAVMQYHRSE